MSKPNMRRFVARSIVDLVDAAQIAGFILCGVLIVVIPVGFAVAAYYDPIPRVILLGMALTAAVLSLVGMCCENIYEWAKRSSR